MSSNEDDSELEIDADLLLYCMEEEAWCQFHDIEISVPVPKQGKSPCKEPQPDQVPASVAIVHEIQGQASLHILCILFDSGRQKTFIHHWALPPE